MSNSSAVRLSFVTMASSLYVRLHDHVQEVREPLDAFQQNQLHRIMSIMGHINEDSWPGIANTVHWKRNTQDIRTPRPEYQERLEQHLLQANPNLKTDPRFAHAVDLAQKCDLFHFCCMGTYEPARSPHMQSLAMSMKPATVWRCLCVQRACISHGHQSC